MIARGYKNKKKNKKGCSRDVPGMLKSKIEKWRTKIRNKEQETNRDI